MLRHFVAVGAPTEEIRQSSQPCSPWTWLAFSVWLRILRARHMKFLTTLLVLAMLTASTLADGPVRHVVHFKFKADADPATVQKVVTEFAKLKAIPVVESIEYGKDVSPEGLNKGFTHCWIVSFKSEADRDVYLKHPLHQAFIGILKPVLDEAMVVDFIPQK
jgi:hypothetical protein